MKKEKRPPPSRDQFYRPPRACDIGFWQVATARLRRWPDFLIIGTQRGGTTSLYEYLSRHPNVAPASEKEIHYFDFQHRRGPAWYRGHFPLRLPDRRMTGEASPFYLFHPRVPRLVRSLLPDVRLIVLLRDPVERAHSHYRLLKNARVEPLDTFEEALQAEPERLAGEAENVRLREDYYSYNYHHYSYMARGAYLPQLEAWLEHFPRRQLLVLPSEELHARPAAFFARVDEFLDLPLAGSGPDGTFRLNHHPGEPMQEVTRKGLQTHFAPYNAALFEMLGTRFDWQ